MSIIRQVQERDIPSIETMQAEWVSEYRLYNRWDEDVLRQGLGPYFLAYEQNDQLVCYVLAENRIQRSHNDVLVHDLFVRRPFRGRRFATDLLNAILHQARSDQAPLCRLTPSCEPEGLDDLVAMYGRHGFEWDDTNVFMILRL